ncbi:MAG TPA: (E)-4-hydroxy-3-methylbut-2-enyl-diphosphate synthase [Bacteroidales bacterium]|nr:(E)-4-hydroxy-3-methylbut-2-enyl-diphosphate synthase [Bacteroidales bacterium]
MSPFQGDERGSNSSFQRNLFKSTPILIGSIPLGGNNPVRLQSMTNTDTLDTKASVAQCIRIFEAGADFVRLTAQGTREAENLALIKDELKKAGFNNPLIADIHFNPSAAETAARIVEKVRINPGNYTDKRASFQNLNLSEKEYNEELEKIHSRLLPLIKICHEYGTAIRIGINHGSLSDRIMNRYGNTPRGMVQSALEFIQIFRNENFRKIVLSMKSSDTDVMIKSTRMLVDEMLKLDIAFPIHLGVTEAGEGEDGRIRSAAGIGALLQDGIGDTIRVSLSEDPEFEIPVAKKLADYFSRRRDAEKPVNALTYTTPSTRPGNLSRLNGPIVVADFRSHEITNDSWISAGFRNDDGIIKITDKSADIVLADFIPADIPVDINLAVPHKSWQSYKHLPNIFPVLSPKDIAGQPELSVDLNIILTNDKTTTDSLKALQSEKTIIIFTYDAEKNLYAPQNFMNALKVEELNFNIILNPVFSEDNPENLQLKAAGVTGIYLADKSIAGIMISNTSNELSDELTGLAFSILQCTDKRITRTMYISCPTCGRTKFNLQDTVKKVKAATGNLKGLKIAVMGCIVNGPGEMAGADYGYVGAAPGKVHIYKGVNPVIKNVPEEDAVNELLRIITEDNK